jgi:hypothetical protein
MQTVLNQSYKLGNINQHPSLYKIYSLTIMSIFPKQSIPSWLFNNYQIIWATLEIAVLIALDNIRRAQKEIN